MMREYNQGYLMMNEMYDGTRYVILKNFNEIGSKIYKIKNEIEGQSLQRILELVVSNDMQVVVTNSPTTYSEYSPYTEITDLREFMITAINS